MTDQELADKVVALGVGECTDSGYYMIPDCGITGYGEHIFVRDWRVAGALMEKCPSSNYLQSVLFDALYEHDERDSLPRAIIEACVEALE